MEIIIRQAKIIDSSSQFNNQTVDIKIVNNVIDEIAQVIEEKETNNAQVIEANNLHVSPGWCDIEAKFGEPGNEHKETLETGAKAAAKGGYTTVAISANTYPVIDTKGLTEYIAKRGETLSVKIVPIASLSEKMEGKNFTEFYDLMLSGAVAFSDDKKAIQSPDLIRRSLDYAKPIDAKLFSFPFDKEVARGGYVNESATSTLLGLKGIPNLAEEIAVSRDLSLVEYCDASLHFSRISTAKSVDLIRKAKLNGLDVTCGVSIANLIWTDKELNTFDTNYKVLPPLRNETDRLALIEGVKDGTIDVIISDHTPENIENKFCEFDLAHFGMNTIEFMLPLIQTYLAEEIGWELLIDKLSINTRKLINQDKIEIKKGEKANLTLFSTTDKSIIQKENRLSISENSPLFGKELQGKTIGTIC